ncbi:hypothetical protein G7046_g4624 [Stylonectria norvegica]|nr:hypothetical protein G7046_g4624 [Stylonectria norvegica]
MDGFSVLSLTSLTTSISHRAISSAEELNDVVSSVASQDAAAQQLAAFATALHVLNEKAVQLEDFLNDSFVVSERLRNHLSQSLALCDAIVAVVNKQVMRLQANTLVALDATFLVAYTDAIVTYSRLFFFLAKLLTLNQRSEQDECLDKPDGKEILEQAEFASHQASQIQEILLSEAFAAETLSSNEDQTASSRAEPPPYEAPVACGSGSSQNTGFGKTLSQSFKAFTAGFRAKPDPLVTALCQAALRGDVQQMKGFVLQGTNINGRNDEGNTPLSCAILANQKKAVEYLLSAGADLKSGDWSKTPPLFLAASVGSIDVARLLVSRGANVNEKNWSGQLFFAETVEGGNMEGILFLLQHGANPNTTNLSGRRVIVQPVKKGNVKLTTVLLQHGADVNSNDISGNSLLFLAAAQENYEMTKLLLDHGANPNGRNVSGTSVLADAIAKRRLDFAKNLLERGADANTKDLYGQKILITALKDTQLPESDKYGLIRSLLTYGADANAADNTWKTPAICIAMDNKDPQTLKLLLQHGANANKKMSSGETLLLHAIDNNRAVQAKPSCGGTSSSSSS